MFLWELEDEVQDPQGYLTMSVSYWVLQLVDFYTNLQVPLPLGCGSSGQAIHSQLWHLALLHGWNKSETTLISCCTQARYLVQGSLSINGCKWVEWNESESG